MAEGGLRLLVVAVTHEDYTQVRVSGRGPRDLAKQFKGLLVAPLLGDGQRQIALGLTMLRVLGQRGGEPFVGFAEITARQVEVAKVIQQVGRLGVLFECLLVFLECLNIVAFLIVQHGQFARYLSLLAVEFSRPFE